MLPARGESTTSRFIQFCRGGFTMRHIKASTRLSRRDLWRFGIGIAGAAALGKVVGPRPAWADGPPPTPIRFTPFTRELPMPATHQVGFSTAEPDPNDNATTGWYHDHATAITGPNVYHGLAGFFLFTDDLEQRLLASNTLPAAAFDVPLVLQDRRFNADGSLFYNPFDHDGFLGDVFVANGKAQPFFRVQRRKYRFRILAGTTARMWFLRLSNEAQFLKIGNDTWLLPFAIQRDRIFLSMAERADVGRDFHDAPDVVFLENILRQDSGRGPGGDLQNPDVQIPGTPLVKFVVEGPNVANYATIQAGDLLRPNTPISAAEIVATRQFEFNRSEGAWQVNGQFFDENRSDANPAVGSAERWILQ